MSRVEKSAVINSDPEKIIEYIADVANHPAFIGPLKAVSNVRGDSKQLGTTWDWTFVMAGVEFSGQAETVKYVRARQFSYRTTSGITSTFNYSAEPAGKGTRVSVDVEYDVPRSLLGKMQASVVEKLNDAEGVRAVENLKAILDE